MRRPFVVAGASTVLIVFGALLAYEFLVHRRDVFTRSDLSGFPWMQYDSRCDASAPAAGPDLQPPAGDRRTVALADGCVNLWPKPATEPASVGKGYPHTLDFHCSVDPTEFDGSFWYLDEIEIDKGATPPGLRSWEGTMSLTGPNAAEFRTGDSDSPILRFVRHRGPTVALPCA